MTLMGDSFDKPCLACTAGDHDRCIGSVCGCLAAHPGDEPAIAGFKRLKRSMHPEREAWTAGGWA